MYAKKEKIYFFERVKAKNLAHVLIQISLRLKSTYGDVKLLLLFNLECLAVDLP